MWIVEAPLILAWQHAMVNIMGACSLSVVLRLMIRLMDSSNLRGGILYNLIRCITWYIIVTLGINDAMYPFGSSIFGYWRDSCIIGICSSEKTVLCLR